MFFFKKKELVDVVCSSLSKMRGNRLKLKKNPRPGDGGGALLKAAIFCMAL